MKKQEKIFAVANLAEGLKQAKSIVLTDYRGLTVPQISQLRTLVKKAGGQFLVVKNTLLKLALKEQKLPELELSGPTALVLAYQDELAPIKSVFDFAKTQGLPTFKSGIWEDRALTKEEVEKLGSLPSRQELIVNLLSLLRFPSERFVNVLGANTKKLILVLNAKCKMKN
ncbi:MAG: 50S ribosomal protein L10 [Patescibacteria group bacterium]